MKEKFDLAQILRVLKKNYKLLIITPLTCLIVSTLLTFLVMPTKYSASTQILVNIKQASNDLAYQNVQSSLQSVNTYAEIIKSPRILDKVSKNLDGKYTPQQLNANLSVTNQAESQIINVSVVSGNKNEAVTIVNEITKVFAKDVPKIMNVDNVTILSKADHHVDKVSPKVTINLLLSVMIGLTIALIYSFLTELLDKRVKTETDVETLLELPILGTIQKF